MKKNKKNIKIFRILGLACCLLLVFFISAQVLHITGYFAYNRKSGAGEASQRIGYCPSMRAYAGEISEKNGFEPVLFGSAAEVLNALKKNEIGFGLIGRKAYSYEKDGRIKETILETGYTLVSNEKKFIDYSRFNNFEIHTHISEEIAGSIVPANNKIIYHDSKESALGMISEGKNVLISWDDWEEILELVVVMNGFEKVDSFRGVFVYSYETI